MKLIRSENAVQPQLNVPPLTVIPELIRSENAVQPQLSLAWQSG